MDRFEYDFALTFHLEYFAQNIKASQSQLISGYDLSLFTMNFLLFQKFYCFFNSQGRQFATSFFAVEIVPYANDCWCNLQLFLGGFWNGVPPPLVENFPLAEFLLGNFQFGRNLEKPIGSGFSLFDWQLGHPFGSTFAFEHIWEISDKFLFFFFIFLQLLFLFCVLHII